MSVPGPTRSAETNRLVALCHDWSAGLISDAELQQVVQSRSRETAEARADFCAAAGPNLVGAAARKVCGGFDAYQGALSGIGQCSKHSMEGFVNALERASHTLFWAFQEYYAHCPPLGPTPYVVLNALFAAAEAARTGGAASEVGVMAARAQTHFERCVKEIREAPADEPAEAFLRVQSGLEECVAGILEVAKFAGDSDAQHLDRGLQEIRDAVGVVAQGWELYGEQKYVGPTSSMVANTYIQAACSLRAGDYSPGLFLQSLDALDEHLINVRKEFERMQRAYSNSASIQEQISRSHEALKVHEEANAAYRRYFNDTSGRHLDDGNAKLIEAMKLLDEVKAALRSAEHRGKTVCPHCFTPNHPSHRSCISCSTALPRFVPEAEHAPSSFSFLEGDALDADDKPVLTANMKRLIDETDAVAEAKISPAEYAATLDWMDGLLDHALANLPRLVPGWKPAEEEAANAESTAQVQESAEADDATAGSVSLARETEQLFTTGVERMRQGLNELRAFTQRGNRQHLVDGLRTAWEASQQIYHARRVGEMVLARLPRDQHEPAEVDAPEIPLDHGTAAEDHVTIGPLD